MNVHELQHELHVNGAHRSDPVVAVDVHHGNAGEVVRVHRSGAGLELEVDGALEVDHECDTCYRRHAEDLGRREAARILLELVGDGRNYTLEDRAKAGTPLEDVTDDELALELVIRLGGLG